MNILNVGLLSYMAMCAIMLILPKDMPRLGFWRGFMIAAILQGLVWAGAFSLEIHR